MTQTEALQVDAAGTHSQSWLSNGVSNRAPADIACVFRWAHASLLQCLQRRGMRRNKRDSQSIHQVYLSQQLVLKNFGFSEGGVASGALGIRTIAMLGPGPRIGQHHGVLQVSSKLCPSSRKRFPQSRSQDSAGYPRWLSIILLCCAVYDYSWNRSLACVFEAFIVSRPSRQTVRFSENRVSFVSGPFKRPESGLYRRGIWRQPEGRCGLA